MREKKFSALPFLQERLDQLELIKNDPAFNSKYFFMFALSQSLRKMNLYHQAIQILEDLVPFCQDVVGEKNEETIKSMFEIAKCYTELIP